MDSDRWRRIGTLFDQAVALPPDERPAFLDDACADDPALRDEVLALLEADADPHPALNDPPDEALPAVAKGQRIGPYRILRPLGEGGMGTVYLAERKDVDKQVAVKVVRGGRFSPRTVDRFQEERRILARLHHPNIARFLDAGVTDDDTPYVVLEYVDGQPINAYCDDRRLSVPERLRLFAETSHAVQHAHQNFVVHRDLKPSNILVTEDDDGQPQVKLLDFGIAKLISDEALDAPGLTRTGMRVLTPEYAAPEQVRGEPISAATDVYALGVLLYELLTGQRPYDVTGKAPHEAERIILDSEPEKPSTAVTRAASTETEERTSPGQVRSTTAEQLRRTLRGDLDTIAMKALRKEPERRYPSAEAFVDDIKRHLEGLPVTARPDTLRYRAGKFVRRNRSGVLAGLVGLLLVVAGTGYYITRITEARDRAQTEARKSERVVDFMLSMFQASDPDVALGDTVQVRHVLEQAYARTDALADQPEVKAEMLSTLGRVYRTLGSFEKARPLFEEALAVQRQLHDGPHRTHASLLRELGLVSFHEGAYAQAESLFTRSLDQFGALGDRSPEYARTLSDLGTLYLDEGAYPQAESVYVQALAIPAVQNDSLQYGVLLNNLGAALLYQGTYDRAEQRFREAMGVLEALGDTARAQLIYAYNGLGGVMRESGRKGEARAPYERSLELRRAIYGPDHATTAIGHFNLALLLKDVEVFDRSEHHFTEAIRVWREALGDDHPYVSIGLGGLATMLLERGDAVLAEETFHEALVHQRAVFDAGHHRIGTTLTNLGRAILAQEDPARALPYLEEGYSVQRGALGEEHYSAAFAQGLLGACYAQLGQDEKAESLLPASLQQLEALRGSPNPLSREIKAYALGTMD